MAMPIESQRSRSQLDYEWIATYNDGSTLRQFDDENETEHHFGHIELSRLYKLTLEATPNKTPPVPTYTLDLRTGIFSSDGVDISTPEIQSNFTKDIPIDIKPILFRRVRRTLNATGKEAGAPRFMYFLGWEGTVNGEKQKKGMQIAGDGTFSVPPRDSFHAY